MHSNIAKLQIVSEPEENYKKGYIKLFRTIDDHWISSNPYYYQAFVRMIIKVNHTNDTVLIEGEIITCNRGQAIYSLNSWSDIFNKKLSKRYWTIQKVRTFFKLLQSDNMIEQKGLRKTTRVTICNYDSYQDNQQTDNRQITDRQQGDNKEITTSKELKELKELKSISKSYDFYKSQIDLNANKPEIENYKKFYDILLGTNSDDGEMTGLLNMDKQVTYKSFLSLMKKSKIKDKKFSKIMNAMSNNPKYFKRISLSKSLHTWLDNDFK